MTMYSITARPHQNRIALRPFHFILNNYLPGTKAETTRLGTSKIIVCVGTLTDDYD
jgi:hypothetical protein